MKSVLLADDHAIVRYALKNVLRDSFHVDRIDEAANETDIKNHVKKWKYDLIVLDINMPKSDFAKTLEWISILSSETSVLVFTMHDEEVYGLRSLHIGAKGFLQKTCSDDELYMALKTTLAGKSYIGPNLAEILVNSKDNGNTLNPFLNLSSRELEIATFLSNGLPLPEICSILNIQYSTGNTYKRRIMEKLHVNNVVSMSKLMSSYNLAG